MPRKKARIEDEVAEEEMSDAINDFRVNTTFITITFPTPANSTFLEEVGAKFKLIVDNLQQADAST